MSNSLAIKESLADSCSTLLQVLVPASISMCLSVGVLSANTFAEEPVALAEEIVVTGSRTPKNLVDSSVSVAVMQGDTIRQVSQTTVAQALNVMPGVVVKRSVKEGYNVYMQGFDGDHVLVLLDGQPLVSPSGTSVDLEQISVADIERIEIVRGASSVLYGSAAMGGVINIITRQHEGSYLSAHSEWWDYGENGIDDEPLGLQTRVQGGVQHKGWYASGQVQTINDGGLDYDKTTIKQNASALEKQFTRITLGRTLEPLKIEYRFQQLDEEKDRDERRVVGQSSVINYVSYVDQTQQDLRFIGNSDAPVNWQVNSRHITHNEFSGESSGRREAAIQLSEVDGQLAWGDQNNEWVTGAVLHTDSLDQKKLLANGEVATVEVDDVSRESVELFVQGSWFSPANELTAGARVQNDSDFGWHHAFRVSGLKTFDLSEKHQLQWRAGVGDSYRVPSLKERFFFFDHSNLGYMVLGNEDLQPEVARSINNTLTWDTSFNQYRNQLRVELNFHYSKAKNFIDTVIDPEQSAEQGLDISGYQNIAAAVLQGADFSADADFGTWQAQLNYSYLDAREDTGRRLEERPYHQIKANIAYEFSPWNISALLYAVHERDQFVPQEKYAGIEQNQWTSWNFNVSQKVNKYVSWRAGIDNMFDEHESADAKSLNVFDIRPVSSRKIFVSLSVNFI